MRWIFILILFVLSIGAAPIFVKKELKQSSQPKICENVTFKITVKNRSGQKQRIVMRDGIETYTDTAADDWYTTKNAFKFTSVRVQNNNLKKIRCGLVDDEDGAKYLQCDTISKRPNNFIFVVWLKAKAIKSGNVHNTAHGYYNNWDWQGSSVAEINVQGANRSASLSINNAQIVEGNSGERFMEFNITANPSPTQKITFHYQTHNLTATAGEDYRAQSGTLTLLPCQESLVLKIPILGDKKYEEDEKFSVKLSNIQGNATFKRDTAIGLIIDDDLKRGEDQAPNFSLCSQFQSGLNSLASIEIDGHSLYHIGSLALYTSSLVRKNGDIKCKSSDSDQERSCSTATPNFLALTIPLVASKETTNLQVSGDTVNATQTDYKKSVIHTGATINFNPSWVYKNKNIYYMTFSNLILTKEENIHNSSFADFFANMFSFFFGGGSSSSYDEIKTNTTQKNFTLNFKSGDYYFDNLLIDANDLTINIEGNVRIFVKDKFEIQANNVNINTNTESANLFIYTKGAYKLKAANANIKGYLYAKKAVTFDVNNMQWYGAISSEKNIDLKGNNITIHYTGALGECSYCQKYNLAPGFHMINPFGDIDKSFEIFCTDSSPKHTLIALPIKNKFNNFVYNHDTLNSTDYYKEAKENSRGFVALEIAINQKKHTIKVVTEDQPTPRRVANINLLGNTFSNINLIGTPFAIDFSSTTIEDCDVNQLRKGYHGQAIKVNTLVAQNDAICSIESMHLKLLDDYRYIEYPKPPKTAQPDVTQEILGKSCKALSEHIPQSILPSSQIKGHFWIYPRASNALASRNSTSNDIRSKQRPFVVYCWYQQDLHNAWTFFLALDGKRTITKKDLVNKRDTCSQLGLWPFVPNTEKTFERVRKFLKENKEEWIHYTGTIDEKVNALYGLHYYLPHEQNASIWPYGSFGLYFDNENGVHEDSFAWGADDEGRGDIGDEPGYMSGAPMHNIPSIRKDYPHYQGNYSWTKSNYPWLTDYQRQYSKTDPTPSDDSYTYADTMGAKGWKTILGKDDLNKTDSWFISRTGAGLNFDHDDPLWPYFEPNGNYEEGCWLNFLYDDEGRVRHTDDWGCNYPYYDYMCMAEDNYDLVKRYDLIKGPFSVIDHDVSNPIANKDVITTKVVEKPINLDVIVMNDARTQLAPDRNISAQIFLSTVQIQGNQEHRVDLWSFGNIQNYDLSTGRFFLPANKWPKGVNKWPRAKRKLFFTFKYCGRNDMIWNDCWNPGINGKCKPKPPNLPAIEWCRVSNSDAFAVRPDHFALVMPTTRFIAKKEANISVYAQAGDNVAALDYNESQGQSFDVNISVIDPSKKCPHPIISIDPINFANGKDTKKHKFIDVGRFKMIIHEINGSEYAHIDANDTPDSRRFITPTHTYITVIPDHFDISAQIQDRSPSNFTYISKDLSMGALLDLNITAKDAQNGVVENYMNSCFAKETNTSFVFGTLPITPTNRGIPLHKILYKEISTNSYGEAPISDGNFTIEFNNSIFTPDRNGSAHLKFLINFDRNLSLPAAPFTIQAPKLLTKDKDDTNGSGVAVGTLHFYYGRLHAPLFKTKENTITTKLFFEVYDPNKNDPAAIEGSMSEEDIDWYRNLEHNTTQYGQIFHLFHEGHDLLMGEDSHLKATLGPLHKGVRLLRLTYKKNKYPYAAKIDLDASRWLIFNKYNPNATTNPLEVIFEGKGNWKGIGTFKTQDEINQSKVPHTRIEW